MHPLLREYNDSRLGGRFSLGNTQNPSCWDQQDDTTSTDGLILARHGGRHQKAREELRDLPGSQIQQNLLPTQTDGASTVEDHGK